MRRLLDRHGGLRLRPRFLGFDVGLSLTGGIHCGGFLPFAMRRPDFKAQALANEACYVLVDRARVRLFLRDAKLRQEIDDHLRFDLQLPGQLIDSNILHIAEHGLDAAYLSRYQPVKITFRQP